MRCLLASKLISIYRARVKWFTSTSSFMRKFFFSLSNTQIVFNKRCQLSCKRLCSSASHSWGCWRHGYFICFTRTWFLNSASSNRTRNNGSHLKLGWLGFVLKDVSIVCGHASALRVQEEWSRGLVLCGERRARSPSPPPQTSPQEVQASHTRLSAWIRRRQGHVAVNDQIYSNRISL